MFFFLFHNFQVKGFGTGHKGNNAGAPATCVTDLADAPQSADPHSCWCPNASVSSAGSLYQPGRCFVHEKSSLQFKILFKIECIFNHFTFSFCQTALLLKTQLPLFTEEAPHIISCVGQGAKACVVDDKYVFPSTHLIKFIICYT